MKESKFFSATPECNVQQKSLHDLNLTRSGKTEDGLSVCLKSKISAYDDCYLDFKNAGDQDSGLCPHFKQSDKSDTLFKFDAETFYKTYTLYTMNESAVPAATTAVE